MADRRQVYIKQESIDSIINDLKGKLISARNLLKKDIDDTNSNSLKSIEGSPLIQEFVAKRQKLVGEDDNLLTKAKNDLKENNCNCENYNKK